MHRHKRRPNSCLFPSLWIFILQTKYIFLLYTFCFLFHYFPAAVTFSLHCNACIHVLDFYYTTRCWKIIFFSHKLLLLFLFFHRLSLSECLHISVTFHVLRYIHKIWIQICMFFENIFSPFNLFFFPERRVRSQFSVISFFSHFFFRFLLVSSFI